MGAPGFISFWLACFVFLVEYATAFGDPGGRLRDLVVLAFRVDFGIMMMDSAINKIGHGYPRNLGMNFGMANPAWSYWPKLFKPLPMNHPLFTFMNHSAWFFQILGGLCLLIPPVQWMGALIIVLSFLLVKCIIRLGVLCDKLMLIPVIYTKSGGWMEQLLTRFYTVDPGILGAHGPVPVVNEILTAVLWAYIILLPLAKLGMYTNFYFKKTLPGLLQTALEKFTAAFGIILWRVFTIDLINFFLLAYFEDPKTGERILHTRFGHWKWNQTNRFLWVGESIMSLIVFNTERYFQEPGLFEKRVIRYARTMPCPEGWNVVFEYVVLSPTPHGFDYLPAREFRVDLKKETVEQRILDEKAVQVKQRFTSPVRATARPGSYAPVKP